MIERYSVDFELNDDNSPHALQVSLVGNNKKVLEIGCATGSVSRYLYEYNHCDVIGVDVDENARIYCNKFCKTVLIGDIDDDVFREKIKDKFDVVLLGDVLEHLRNPGKILASLKEKLVSGGYILVTLPNVLVWHTRLQFLIGKFEYTETGTLDKNHLRFFTVSSAKELVRSAGFKIDCLKYTYNIPFLNRVISFIERRELRILTPLSFLLKKVGHKLANLSPGLFANHLILRLVIDESH